MFKEMKILLRKYCFVSTVIGCVVIFCCGTLTASQKTAYNIYLKKYAELSIAATSRKVGVSIDEREYTLALPDEEKLYKLGGLLKFTPLAPFVFVVEQLTENKTP